MITSIHQLPLCTGESPGLDCVAIGTPIYIVNIDGDIDPFPRQLTLPIYGAANKFTLDAAASPFWAPKIITALIYVCETYHYWIFSDLRRRQTGWSGFITTPESPRLVEGMATMKSRMCEDQFKPCGTYPFLSSKRNAIYMTSLGAVLPNHTASRWCDWCDCPSFKFKKYGQERGCKHLTQLKKFHTQGRLW